MIKKSMWIVGIRICGGRIKLYFDRKPEGYLILEAIEKDSRFQGSLKDELITKIKAGCFEVDEEVVWSGLFDYKIVPP